jgi:hypothetical protein
MQLIQNVFAIESDRLAAQGAEFDRRLPAQRHDGVGCSGIRAASSIFALRVPEKVFNSDPPVHQLLKERSRTCGGDGRRSWTDAGHDLMLHHRTHQLSSTAATEQLTAPRRIRIA